MTNVKSEDQQDKISKFTADFTGRNKMASRFKRDRHGNAKKFDGPKPAAKPAVRNAYTPMFEGLRDELDAHHDRRDRIGKVSRDITALSKKM